MRVFPRLKTSPVAGTLRDIARNASRRTSETFALGLRSRATAGAFCTLEAVTNFYSPPYPRFPPFLCTLYDSGFDLRLRYFRLKKTLLRAPLPEPLSF